MHYLYSLLNLFADKILPLNYFDIDTTRDTMFIAYADSPSHDVEFLHCLFYELNWGASLSWVYDFGAENSNHQLNR